ncbi:MAG: hypothetical protein RLZZ591_2308 [Pseudomonadota bacterium]
MASDFSVQTHTGIKGNVRRCILDETGRLYLDTKEGFGLLHTQDVVYAPEAIASMGWALEEMQFAEMPKNFGYESSPLQASRKA